MSAYEKSSIFHSLNPELKKEYGNKYVAEEIINTIIDTMMINYNSCLFEKIKINIVGSSVGAERQEEIRVFIKYLFSLEEENISFGSSKRGYLNIKIGS